MSEETGIGDGRGEDDVLVAEYVLGLLPPAEHAALARRIAGEPALATSLRFWQSRLSTLDDQFAESAPPPAVWNRLEQRLFAERNAAPAVSWWDSLAFWRGLSGLAAAVAVIAVGFNLLQPARLSPDEMATELVAALQSQEGSGVEFVAFYDTGTGAVRLLGVSGQPVDNKDFELWYIRGDEPAVSMGVIPVDQRTEIPLDQTAREKIDSGTILAVTLEQKGGSPTGVAQGPIVALGKATPI